MKLSMVSLSSLLLIEGFASISLEITMGKLSIFGSGQGFSIKDLPPEDE